MPKCVMCSQNTVKDSKFCYLHKKYDEGLCGPDCETLWDRVVYEQTFDIEWKEHSETALQHGQSEKNERLYEDSRKVDGLRQRVKLRICRNAADISEYIPLVQKLARYADFVLGIDFDDAFQALYWKLFMLNKNTEEGADPKEISAYFKRALEGETLNLRRRESLTCTEFIEDDHSEETTVDDQLMEAMTQRYKQEMIQKLSDKLTRRQSQVFHMLLEDMPVLDISRDLGISVQRVRQIINAIYTIEEKMV